ncbi:hypothetical protein [Intestinibacillus sp. Marseille-P6563]|uniref:hypothetical protein n=1 Tax=Intestinibacillus sp. Marseille-P6563 TaxID=2364792 RepID=UPI000F0455A7|nr:hypothetical protein [Intestinibacillus sp. Marseille-P6563]
MKKGKLIVSTALAFALAAGMTAGAVDQTAKATTSKVLVDGKEISFTAYEINDYNYFKLRDIAAAVNGSAKQFAVGWDAAANAISLTSSTAYTPAGGELEPPASMENATAKETNSAVSLDGTAQDFDAYEINDYNYFKLRDVCAALDIEVGWDAATQTITLTTTGAAEDEGEQEQPTEEPTANGHILSPAIDQPIVRPEGENVRDVKVYGGVYKGLMTPVAGAQLEFYADAEGTQLIGTTTTDENGEYELMLPVDMTLDPFHIGRYKGQIWVEAYWVDAQGNKYSNVDGFSTPRPFHPIDDLSIEVDGGINSSIWISSSPTNW